MMFIMENKATVLYRMMPMKLIFLSWPDTGDGWRSLVLYFLRSYRRAVKHGQRTRQRDIEDGGIEPTSTKHLYVVNLMRGGELVVSRRNLEMNGLSLWEKTSTGRHYEIEKLVGVGLEEVDYGSRNRCACHNNAAVYTDVYSYSIISFCVDSSVMISILSRHQWKRSCSKTIKTVLRSFPNWTVQRLTRSRWWNSLPENTIVYRDFGNAIPSIRPIRTVLATKRYRKRLESATEQEKKQIYERWIRESTNKGAQFTSDVIGLPPYRILLHTPSGKPQIVNTIQCFCPTVVP